VTDVILHLAQDLFEIRVLRPVGDDLDAPEDGIARPDQGRELLVEHDEVAVLDFFLEGEGGELELRPVAPDGQDAEAQRLEVAAAVRGRDRQAGLRDEAPVLGGHPRFELGHPRISFFLSNSKIFNLLEEHAA
jgi:hypothetical protein